MSDRRAMQRSFDGPDLGPSTPAAQSTTTSVTVNKPSQAAINDPSPFAKGGADTPITDLAATLYYPLENQDFYKAAIRFSLYSVDPYEIDANAAKDILDRPFLTSLTKAGKEADRARVTENSADQSRLAAEADAEIPPEVALYGAGDVKAHVDQETALSGTNRDLSLAPKKMNQETILYFPPGVILNDAVIYDTNATLGPGGATGLAALRNGSSLLSSVSTGVMEGASDLFNLLRGDVLTQEAAQVAATRAFNRLPSGGIQNMTRIALQKLVNPNTRTMFQGVPIREFAFTFRMIATSKSEAKEIETIIRRFRTELYPEAIQIGGLPLGFKFPNLFKINFMYNGVVNKAMPQPLMCYLRSVQTTYNQGNMVFHEDGQPTEVDLTLSFAEFRALTRKDIDEGSDASGGPH